MSKTHRDAYKALVKRSLAAAQASVEKFAKALVEDPVHALEWSDDVYMHGARVALFRRVDSALENDQCQLKHVVETIENEMVGMARFIYNRSTGQGKNRLEDCKLSVWTEELQEVRRFYERELKEAA